MSYFTMQELTTSQQAKKYNIDNTPSPDIKVKILNLINNCLDPIREAWGKPIIVNSGFRCYTLNVKVGGAAGSLHTKGMAADITTGSVISNKRLYRLIKTMVKDGNLSVHKCINEFGFRWLHVSYISDEKNGKFFYYSVHDSN